MKVLDDFLRGRGIFGPDRPVALRLLWFVVFTLVGGGLYGAAMGSFGLWSRGDPRLWGYAWQSAVKVPMLLLVTFALCVPFFLVVNSLAGVRDDFAEALGAVVGTLACLSMALVALAPVTLFWYASVGYYDAAILFNGAMFLLATLAAVRVVARYYGPLIRRTRMHARMLALWFGIYIFVAIQMAWTLRPFIGDPNPEVPVVFFRSADVDNAYLELVRLFRQVWDAWMG